MTHDFKAVLEAISVKLPDDPTEAWKSAISAALYRNTLEYALRLAEKVMGEPDHLIMCSIMTDIFKDGWENRDLIRCKKFYEAMRDQIIKEIEDERNA